MSIKLLLGGDVMLGRLFNSLNAKDPSNSPWSSTIEQIMTKHDGTIVNLETTISSSEEKWPDKIFNYKMLPRNGNWLKEANIVACSLANNHILDYQLQGLLDTQNNLEKMGIAHAGAGLNLKEAMQAQYLTWSGNGIGIGDLRIGFLSAADHYDYWAATESSPGIWYIPIRGGPHPEWKKVFKHVRKIRKQCDLLIFSLHWNYNYVRGIDPEFTEFAHRLIDNGVDIIHGHSPHHLLPIEHYQSTKKSKGSKSKGSKGNKQTEHIDPHALRSHQEAQEEPRRGIIFYSLGDFIDDYAVDSTYRNDLGALAQISILSRQNPISGDRGVRCKLTGIFPTQIEDLRVDIAKKSTDRAFIMKSLEEDHLLY